MNEKLKEYNDKMQKSFDFLKEDLASIRAGRANPHVLDKIKVDYYGTPTPLRQMSQVTVQDGTTLVITPYDKSILKTNQVRLVCGGGSGHEPAHGGFVLEGGLTCAVCGDIFSSPSCKSIIKAINEIYSDSGVIIIVKNYTGDIINFSLACELFKSQNKKVELVIVDDDISLTNQNDNNNENNNFNKRRGLCGTVLLYKILGNLSQNYYSFEEILNFAKNIIPSL
jgi:dihydroxyacetone kinase